MMRTVKISMILVLGLSLSNQLVAMESNYVEETTSNFILIYGQLMASAQEMNEACLKASYEEAAKYNDQDDQAGQKVITAGALTAHALSGTFMELLNQIPQVKDQVNTKLHQLRLDIFTGSYPTIGSALQAVEKFCSENCPALEKIKNEYLASIRQPSQYDLDFQHELNHQT